MTKREERLVRKHLMLYEHDMEYLEAHFGETIGLSDAVRRIIRQFIKQLEARALSGAKPTAATSLDLGPNGPELRSE